VLACAAPLAMEQARAAPAGPLADRYPGDAGIEKDPAVLFAEGFEGEALPQAAYAQPGGFYDLNGWPALLRVAAGAAAGAKCLELVHPANATSPQWLHRRFAGSDAVYVRFYGKFAADWTWAPMGSHDTFLFAGAYGNR